MADKTQENEVLSADDIQRTLQRLSHEIREKNPGLKEVALIGIQTRGVFLAQRIQKILKELENIDLPLGTIDITFYRDDLTAIGPKPQVKETRIPCDIDKKTIVLIDDVLFTGRTIRSALNEIMDFGRPRKVELLVLVDRGHRELPIRADFVGKNIPTSADERVDVRLKEVDGSDQVVVGKKPK
jgi:pyrimidine operon attenuation protein / uracil phosphoribosyltransferase